MDENNNRNGTEAGATVSPEASFEVPAAAEAHGLGFLLGVLTGTLVGAGLATVLAPARGEQLRARTAEKAPELWRRREELAREARDKARVITSDVRSRFGEALEASREAAQEAQQEARRRFELATGRRSGTPYP